MVFAPKAILFPAILGLALLPWSAVGAPADTRDAGMPVSYRNDVMAVISRAGCNAGACHGNASGKGGFKIFAGQVGAG